jgi:DNA-binding IclR family transcriptional regulator
VAAIAVASTSERMTMERVVELLPDLRKAADEIAALV